MVPFMSTAHWGRIAGVPRQRISSHAPIGTAFGSVSAAVSSDMSSSSAVLAPVGQPVHTVGTSARPLGRNSDGYFAIGDTYVITNPLSWQIF